MPAFIQKIINFFMTILIFLGLAKPTAPTPDKPVEPEIPASYTIVYDNIEKGLISGKLTPRETADISDVNKIKSLMKDDGQGGSYFSDTDYTKLDVFRPRNHLTRLFYVAMLASKADGDKKAEYIGMCRQLANHWATANYKSTNWWYNEIFTPEMLINTLYLLRGELAPDTEKALLDIVEYGVFTKNDGTLTNTGANCLDVAVTSIKYGAYTDDYDTVKFSVDKIRKEIGVAKWEGIKSDGSFFQHGSRLYIGGYGIDFLCSVTFADYMLKDSAFTLGKEALQPLCNYVLKGLGTVCYGNTIDPVVMGRNISRNNIDDSLRAANYLKVLADNSDINNKNDIKALIVSIENNTKSDKGVRYFDVAKLIVINNSDFYFSWRGGAKGLKYGESLNNENILAYNTSYPGCTTIMSDGKAIKNLMAYRDYSLYPGTTAVYETDAQLLEHKGWNDRTLSGSFPEYSSKGLVISSAQTSHEGSDMTVACFATDSSAVILGSGMRNAEGKDMITTIDQCNYAGTHSFDGKNIIHDGIKYTVLEGGEVTVRTEKRSGSYNRNNLSENSTVYSSDVFFATINNTGSYAYSVMAEKTTDTFTVIENTETVQAVKLPDGRVAAVFYTPCSFSYNGRTYSSSSTAAMVFDK